MTSRRPDPSLSEAALIRKAKKGDEQAFARLVRTYEGTVYSFAYKVCRDGDKASETVQDTFINVYQKLKQFDGRSKFSTWLYSDRYEQLLNEAPEVEAGRGLTEYP